MYQLHYDLFKAHYSDAIKLLYTDTDSFIYLVETKNLYDDLARFKDMIDFSDYSPTHPLYSRLNRKVIGKLKDELNGKTIFEVIALKSKLYAISSEEGEKKRAKGTQRCRVESDLTRDMYFSCLLRNGFYETVLRRLESNKHKIRTAEQTRMSLTSFDDKRYYIDPVYSYAHGHYRIKE